MKEGQSPLGEVKRNHPSHWRTSENRWIVGFSFLLMGVIFLVQNLTGWQMDDWWYLFLIVPAFASFITAWQRSKESEQIQSWRILRPLALGLFLLAMMFVLIFNLGWFMIPAGLLLIAGILLIVGVFIK
jgi:hypothetical protein